MKALLKTLVIISLALYSCHNKKQFDKQLDTSVEQNKSANQSHIIDSNNIIKSLKQELNFNDSIKIVATDNHLITFIDFNKNSKFHKELKKWFLSNWNDTAAYNSGYYFQKNKVMNNLNFAIPSNLKTRLIPIYSFKNEFYVYKSCSFQVSFELNDSSFNDFFMDGQYPNVIKHFKKIDDKKYEIQTAASPVTIELADPKMSIYKIKHRGFCGYFIPIDRINNFPIIVFRCDNMTEDLITFDKVECK